MEPIVFQFALFVILPVARECIDPFRFWFEEFGKMPWRKYLDIISRGESIDGVQSNGNLQVCEDFRAQHVRVLITGSDLVKVVCDLVETARYPKGAAIDVGLYAKVLDFDDQGLNAGSWLREPPFMLSGEAGMRPPNAIATTELSTRWSMDRPVRNGSNV